MASGTSDDIHCVTSLVSRLRKLPLEVKILLAAAAPLWAILGAQMWVPVPACDLHLVQPAAPTLTITAILLWAVASSRKRERRMYERFRQMQERERVLIRVIDSLDAERPSPPFQLVR